MDFNDPLLIFPNKLDLFLWAQNNSYDKDACFEILFWYLRFFFFKYL